MNVCCGYLSLSSVYYFTLRTIRFRLEEFYPKISYVFFSLFACSNKETSFSPQNLQISSHFQRRTCNLLRQQWHRAPGGALPSWTLSVAVQKWWRDPDLFMSANGVTTRLLLRALTCLWRLRWCTESVNDSTCVHSRHDSGMTELLTNRVRHGGYLDWRRHFAWVMSASGLCRRRRRIWKRAGNAPVLDNVMSEAAEELLLLAGRDSPKELNLSSLSHI